MCIDGGRGAHDLSNTRWDCYITSMCALLAVLARFGLWLEIKIHGTSPPGTLASWRTIINKSSRYFPLT